jgi:uncharacterized membrane protein YkvA (DUF1232 family)
VSRLGDWARAVKRDVWALWLAARDPRVPWYAKALAAAVVAYALSPIDLIPDFVPVLGYLDELIILPLGILLAIRLVPKPLMAEFRRRAERRDDRPKGRGVIAAVAAVWLAALALSLWLLGPTICKWAARLR